MPHNGVDLHPGPEYQRSWSDESIAAGEAMRIAVLLFLTSAYHEDAAHVRTVTRLLADQVLEIMTSLELTPWMNSLF